MNRKMHDKSGKTMVLALVFLLAAMLLGAAVLAAATANANRAAQQRQENQCYIRNRSAMLLMAQLLQSTPESRLQLTIQDVTVSEGDGAERTVTYQIQGEARYRKSILQKLLYGYAVNRYEEAYGWDGERDYENFDFTDGANRYFSPAGWENATGTFQIEADLPSGTELLEARYQFSENYDFCIVLEDANRVAMHLTMGARCSTGSPVVITVDGRTITTVTTVIQWENPVIGKGDGT